MAMTEVPEDMMVASIVTGLKNARNPSIPKSVIADVEASVRQSYQIAYAAQKAGDTQLLNRLTVGAMFGSIVSSVIANEARSNLEDVG